MIYLELFWTFFKIGAFTFGGGYAMIPLIQSEIVSKGWMQLEELINFIAISQSTPGTFAINISTYIGFEKAGLLGGLCATSGVIFPSFIIILLLAKAYTAFSKNIYVKGCMSGLKPAVVGLIAAAILSVGKKALFPDFISLDYIMSSQFITSMIIFAITGFLAIKKINPILIIAISAVLGIGFGYTLKFIT